jgi:uncharacterized ion transporter superfamily protein YfcC
VPPAPLLRPLLRWISLLASAAVLGTLGVARTHLHNFPLFLAAVLGLAVLVVVVFVVTAGSDDRGAGR